MARKLDKAAPAAAEQPSAAEQLQVLDPNLALTVAGRDIVIREYGFHEGLAVAHKASGFIADMQASCKDGSLRYTRIRRLFGVHADVVTAIAAQAADVEVDWVRALKGADAELFMSAWFSVQTGFFVGEVALELREEQHRAALAAMATGTAFSSDLPAPDSATSTGSDAAPSGS